MIRYFGSAFIAATVFAIALGLIISAAITYSVVVGVYLIIGVSML